MIYREPSGSSGVGIASQNLPHLEGLSGLTPSMGQWLWPPPLLPAICVDVRSKLVPFREILLERDRYKHKQLSPLTARAWAQVGPQPEQGPGRGTAASSRALAACGAQNAPGWVHHSVTCAWEAEETGTHTCGSVISAPDPPLGAACSKQAGRLILATSTSRGRGVQSTHWAKQKAQG